MPRSPTLLVLPLLCLWGCSLRAAPVTVRFPEGTVRGYLALRTMEGEILASGDLYQTIHGGRLTSRLVYHFKDGSVDDETAVFTQSGHFHLLSDHRVQTGPIFPKPLDMTINAVTGMVTVRYSENGAAKVDTSHMDLPDDLSNGILLNLVKNVSPRGGEIKLSYLAATPKPRLIRLSLTPEGKESFRSAGLKNQAQLLKIHVELGGIAGMIAPVIGKEPPDIHVWVSADRIPAFIRSENPLYLGGPLLRTELVSPVWDRAATVGVDAKK